MEDTNNENGNMSEEQAADLRRLEMAAGEPDIEMQRIADSEADQAAKQVAAHADANAGQVRFMLDLAIPILGQMFPSLNDVYTEEARAAVAGTVGPVLTKYEIDLSDMGSKWGPEIACVVVCGPIALATYKGINADLAAAAAKKPQVPKAVASNGQQAPAGPAVVESLG